jgi:hypothetical protein
MPWNRKTTRKDRRLRSRRGQTARGRRRRELDLDFFAAYFQIPIRAELDRLMAYYETLSFGDPFDPAPLPVDTPPPDVP